MTGIARSRRAIETGDGKPSALVAECIASLPWDRIAEDLDRYGCAATGPVLGPAECNGIAELYPVDEKFRSRVVMRRHGFGSGEYKYFAYPLPERIAELRAALYPRLAPIANRWNERMGSKARYPAEHAAFLKKCHAAGQTRPTPLLLKYVAGDYNCLHQDLYGELVFPLQVTVMLDRPDVDFTGGEFLLVEQRPRMQSRGHAIALGRGDAVVFPCRTRAARGARGS